MLQLAKKRQLELKLAELQLARTAPGMASPNPAGRRGKELGTHTSPVPTFSQAGILRRIKRDHPDIAAQVERGDAEHP